MFVIIVGCIFHCYLSLWWKYFRPIFGPTLCVLPCDARVRLDTTSNWTVPKAEQQQQIDHSVDTQRQEEGQEEDTRNGCSG